MNPTSKLHRLRAAIKATLVDAGIWDESAVLIDRQSDFWNDVATAMSAATHNAVLSIGTARGDGSEEDGLENEITVPITILATNTLSPDRMPEELLWERTIQHLHNRVLDYDGGVDHWNYRLRYQGFTDAPELVEANLDVVQLARQTVFRVKLSLAPEQ